MRELQRYMNNVTPQHRAAFRFLAWIQANLERISETDAAALEMQEAFELRSAVGEQLRTLLMTAGIVNITGTHEDAVLTRLLLTKIIKNCWDGTNESMLEIWPAVFGDEFSFQYIDHQDMSATLELTADQPTDFLKIALFRDAIPKPAGVMLKVRLRTAAVSSVPLFAYAAVGSSYLEVRIS